MSSLIFLSSDDFIVQQGERGPIMCTDMTGISIILFYSNQCVYCQQMIPMYKRLPGMINGCHFAMVNLSVNSRVVQMAKTTIAPIQYVPMIVLYVNGKPFMKYNGPNNAESICQFVIEASKMVQSSNMFSSQSNAKVKHHSKSIPLYTIGVPVCSEDGECYMEYDMAYDKTDIKGGER